MIVIIINQLNESKCTGEVMIQHYLLYKNDRGRNSKGGGGALHLKDGFCCHITYGKMSES